jgi:hypothetical protein
MTQARTTVSYPRLTAVLTTLLLASCASPPALETAAAGTATLTGPPGAIGGTCWDKTETPAIVETVTTRVAIAPADVSPAGTIRTPARYRIEETTRIAVPRQVSWTELVCPEDQSSEFVASLQRALAARGDYAGEITGETGPRTQEAIARYQARTGTGKTSLTVEAAQALGLVPRQPRS